ncbi:MAG: hypothetical protein IKI65_02790 [Firmicutes bacterium]|nr:hypothetical protein [Bacillota bacterium]
MKKTWIALLLVFALLAAAGCGKAAETPADTPAPAENITKEIEAPAAEPAPAQEPAAEPGPELPPQIYPDGYLEEEEMAGLLSGLWEFLPNGDIIRLEPYGFFSFGDEDRFAMFNTTDDAQSVSGTYALADIFMEGRGTWNELSFTVSEISEGYADARDILVGETTDLQFLTAQVEGVDALALRYLGNGDTYFSYNILQNDLQATDWFWVFEREPDEPRDIPTDEQYDAMRKKGETFYAFCWRDYGDRCLLQEMAVIPYQEDWYGEMEDCLMYMYPANGHAFTAVPYEIEGMKDYAHSGEYRPGLMRVTTDENGIVTELLPLRYLGYGVYSSEPEMNGAGDDERNPGYYSEHDARFIGEWINPDEPTDRIYISEASPQTGGYELFFSKYPDAEAYANIDGDGLYMNQMLVDGKWVSGTITPGEFSFELTITESDFPGLPKGKKIRYMVPVY